MNESKTFCVFPWIHQMATPPGKAGFCCIAHKEILRDETGTPIELGKNGFAPAWNSASMREIRRQMLNGEPVQGCETCHYQEKIGKPSYRQNSNQEWTARIGVDEIQRRVAHSRENHFTVDRPPVYLDLRLGNLCNLKCRMCNPYNSVQIHKEWNAIDAATDGSLSKFWSRYSMVNGSVEPWYESDEFWKSCEAMIPGLLKVYMTGGEPTLIRGNYRFMRKCIEMGYSGSIELFFNLNFTRLTDEFVELISHFKWTSINASLDGVRETNDYIRYPSRWDELVANFEKLANHPSKNIGLGVSPVIQIYNVLAIVPLLDFVEELEVSSGREILVDFLYCLDPKFLRIENLPAHVKARAAEKLADFKKRSRDMHRTTPKSRFIKDGVNSMLTLLQGRAPADSERLLADFFEYTEILDRHRDQSFSDVFPELASLLGEGVSA